MGINKIPLDDKMNPRFHRKCFPVARSPLDPKRDWCSFIRQSSLQKRYHSGACGLFQFAPSCSSEQTSKPTLSRAHVAWQAVPLVISVSKCWRTGGVNSCEQSTKDPSHRHSPGAASNTNLVKRTTILIH